MEAALLPTSANDAPVEITDYCKELTESLQYAINLAAVYQFRRLRNAIKIL